MEVVRENIFFPLVSCIYHVYMLIFSSHKNTTMKSKQLLQADYFSCLRVIHFSLKLIEN